MTATSAQKTRFHGLDLIRSLSFFAIATFHISLIHYFTREITIANESTIILAADRFSRALSFSGFTILFITSLLTAYSGSTLWSRVRLHSFLSIGWMIFSYTMTGSFFDLIWDIYPLVFSGILSATILEKVAPHLLKYLGLIGFLFLWIPFWEFSDYFAMGSNARAVLGFADCTNQVSEWPVLPWIGLIWFGYAIGQPMRHAWRGHWQHYHLTRKEGIVWAVFLLAGISQWGSFYNINLGKFFACDAYRQPPLTWWGHFIWVMFAVRLCIEPTVQKFLARPKILQFNSRLAINRKFWMAYLLNYLLAHGLSYLVTESGVEQTEWNVPTIAIIAVGFVPVTEVILRSLLAVVGYFVQLFGSTNVDSNSN